MALTIKTEFNVPKPPERVWPALIDIENSAPCFPGAQLKERMPDGSYKGLFSVKLGPMTFAFNGKFRIVAQDDVARTALLVADGTDTKGRGGANAQVRLALASSADAGSDVSVVSDVSLSGSVAQYGRGVSMIEALSKQLLTQFSKSLTAKIAAMPEPVAAPAPVAAPVELAPQVPPAAQTAPTAGSFGSAPARPANAIAEGDTPASAPVQLSYEASAPLDAGALVRGALWLSIKRFFARLFGKR